MIEHIAGHLPHDFPWLDRIHWFDTIVSTNDEARYKAKQGALHGTVLIADHQTGGHGRRGRSFHSPAGTGIYMSVILRPVCAPAELMHLTCAAAVAMCEAVEAATGFRPGIKWTNDLIYGKRKLGGILTELGFTPHGFVDYAIIGIGINCCQKEQDFPPDIRSMAGSVAMAANQSVDRSLLAAQMILALWQMDARLLADKAAILDRYRTDCITLGQEIVLVRGDKIRYGKALDIGSDGALIAELDGSIETVSSGEVSVRGMYGYI